MLQGALSGLSMGADPVKVFNHVNKFLCRHSEVGRYATMFIGIIGRDGMLEYIKAGHPSPLLLRKGQVTELYNEGSFPVGLIPEADYESGPPATRARRHAGPVQRRRHRSGERESRPF
jgi:phosphoserine phosphatase RsbU/P